MPWLQGLSREPACFRAFFFAHVTLVKPGGRRRQVAGFSTRLLFSATTARHSCHCPMAAPFLHAPGARRQGPENSSDSRLRTQSMVCSTSTAGRQGTVVYVFNHHQNTAQQLPGQAMSTSFPALPPGPTPPQTGLSPRNLTSPLARVFGPGSMRMAWSMGFS